MRRASVYLALLFATTGAAAQDISAAERARIDGVVRQEIVKCWKAAEARSHYTVLVRFELNRDGSLMTGPAAVDSKPSGLSDATIQATLQAVRECMPLKLPPKAYDYWRNVQIKFQTQTPGRPFGASAWPQ